MESCTDASEVLGLLSMQLLYAIRVGCWMCRLVQWTKSWGCKRERYSFISQNLWKSPGRGLLASWLPFQNDTAGPTLHGRMSYHWSPGAGLQPCEIKSQREPSPKPSPKTKKQTQWQAYVKVSSSALNSHLLNQLKLDFQMEDGSKPWKMTVVATRRNAYILKNLPKLFQNNHFQMMKQPIYWEELIGVV